MKSETWIFGLNAVFFVIVAPSYWFLSQDPSGTAALIMVALLCTLITIYLGFHASRMDPRPEDRREGDIAEGAGELGFFPPYSWWPLWTAASIAVVVLGLVIGWWLFFIGVGVLSLAVNGFVFEYYRGLHAH